MRFILILFFSVTSLIVEARMYQWTEPGVETTQLSGKPPAWYRGAAGGPRVFVFDKGRLVDDTSIEVSDDVRQRMRQQAFVLAEEDDQKVKEKIAKAKELKEKFKKPKVDTQDEPTIDSVDENELLTEALFPEENKDEEQDKESFTDKNADDLRAMIEGWEKSQTENAKKALE